MAAVFTKDFGDASAKALWKQLIYLTKNCINEHQKILIKPQNTTPGPWVPEPKELLLYLILYNIISYTAIRLSYITLCNIYIYNNIITLYIIIYHHILYTIIIKYYIVYYNSLYIYNIIIPLLWINYFSLTNVPPALKKYFETWIYINVGSDTISHLHQQSRQPWQAEETGWQWNVMEITFPLIMIPMIMEMEYHRVSV